MRPNEYNGFVHRLLLTVGVLVCATIAVAETNLAQIGADCSSLEYHLRLEPLKNTDSQCALVWNYTDSANYRSLRYLIPSLTSSDNLSGFESLYELSECKNGTERVLAQGSFRDSYTSRPALSAMLRVLPESACIELGTGKAAVSVPVPYSHINSFAGYRCSHALRELRNDITAQRTSVPEKSRFQSLDTLRSYIAASKDAYESFWTYLDRDTDITKAVPGARYTLATVSDGHGSYEIIYLDGIGHETSLWSPLTIKGHLYPTIFADHFNLQWSDLYGREADPEANAYIELQGTILRLSFPLLKSSMRFSRIPK